MKLDLRFASLFFVLISISAGADTVRFNLNTSAFIGSNQGAGDNVGVTLSGQGVGTFAMGGTPTFWFDCCEQIYFPGQQGLGPTSIFWDTASMQIGSTGYDFDHFDLDPGFIDAPYIRFPTNGKDFNVIFPWTPSLSGIILSNCPTTGCGFDFEGKTGNVKLTFIYFDGAYYPGGSSFTTVPEPSTLMLLATGIAVAAFRKFRYSA